MSKSINAALLGLILFVPTYCLCFWFGIMPKFYPQLGEIHITPPPGQHIAVKFVGSAIVALAVGAAGFGIGLKLPARCSAALHITVWLVMAAGCVYLVGRETAEYILR